MNVDYCTQLHGIAFNAAHTAGKAIMEIYNTSHIGHKLKKDKSPLTIADIEAQTIISGFLKTTGIPVISEEEEIVEYKKRKTWDLCWIVDPLDGTKEFLKKNGQFTVNIALIKHGIPIIGVIYAPALELMYTAVNGKAYKLDKIERKNDFENFIKHFSKNKKRLPLKTNRKNFIILASQSHQNHETSNYIKNLKNQNQNIEVMSIGSSLKFCMIAEGKADLYPRFSTIMEWDTAAGHAILDAAGGRVINPETGLSLTYNKDNLLNPWFIASK